jgi:hypothetical protein
MCKLPENLSKISSFCLFRIFINFDDLFKFFLSFSYFSISSQFLYKQKLFVGMSRPEVKENKEGADTEKAAEQDKVVEEELVKEKVIKLFNNC